MPYPLVRVPANRSRLSMSASGSGNTSPLRGLAWIVLDAVDDASGEVTNSAVVPHRHQAQHGECVVGRASVLPHEDALGLVDHRTCLQGGAEVPHLVLATFQVGVLSRVLETGQSASHPSGVWGRSSRPPGPMIRFRSLCLRKPMVRLR